MAKGMTKTAVKRKLKTMVTVTKQLLDDRMTNPRTHVVMSPKDLLALNGKFMTKLKAISK
mgnify:FL=1|jgi:hypothetical protein|tara:strand:- start:101 stop:280 length:180 start_codon:yes stop_codon:yes gene_type:complete